MSRAVKVLLLTIGLVVGAVTIVLLLRDNTSQQNKESDGTAAETFTEQNAQYIEEKFNSPSKEEQKLALVPEMRAGEWDTNALFPEGAVLEVDPTSFEGSDENGYAVQAGVVLDGEVLQVYILTIEYVESEDAWLVGGTTLIEGE